MQSKISKKAKNLARLMALTAALCVCAIAVAVVLFFDSWQIGLIALAVSFASGAATALVFAMYKAERRAEKLRMQAERDLDALGEAFPTRRQRPEPTSEDTNISETEPSAEDSKSQSGTPADGSQLEAELSKEGGKLEEEPSEEESRSEKEMPAEGQYDRTTLEMRPPRFLMTVEEAEAHMQNRGKSGSQPETDLGKDMRAEKDASASDKTNAQYDSPANAFGKSEQAQDDGQK